MSHLAVLENISFEVKGMVSGLTAVICMSLHRFDASIDNHVLTIS